MGNEGLAHKELKRKAKDILKEKGFSDNQIFEEYSINGFPRGYIIDIAGISDSKRVAIEVGNLDKLKKAVLEGKIGRIDTKFDEVIHLPYSEAQLRSEMYDEDSESLAERKKYLVACYNEEVYEKLKDDKEFQFQRCKGPDDPEFKVGRFNSWMSLPCGTGTYGQQLQYEINFSIHYTTDNAFVVSINAETNPAIKQFIEQMSLKENKEELLNLFHKLPDICYIQVGYKYKDSKNRAPPYPRNWEDTEPYQCNKLTEEELNEFLGYLEFYLDNGSNFEQYPIMSVVETEVRKEDMSKLFKILKELYKLLFTMDTMDTKQAKEIAKIPDLNWYVKEGKYDMLLEEAKEISPDIDKKKLRKLVKMIKSMNL